MTQNSQSLKAAASGQQSQISGQIHAVRMSAIIAKNLKRQLKQLTYPSEELLKDAESSKRLIEWERYLREVNSVASTSLPPNVKRLLREFAENPHIPAVMITGLPIDDSLPPTPTDGRRPFAKSSVSESVLVSIASFFGEIFSYREELEGAPIHQLAPQKDKEYVQSYGGRVRFKMHNDNRFIPEMFRQKYICLSGLRNTENVSTTFLPVT